MTPSADFDLPADAPEKKTSATRAVLFADIAGSTRLYDSLGDTQAKKLVDECIGLMRVIVRKYGGRVIKTIGDEVMCVLPDADCACLAATDMQHQISGLAPVSGVKRAIRAGFHVGVVLEENNDVFGDTVNLAARMVGLAKAMQIITTRATVEQLSPLLKYSTRNIAALSIRGKGQDVEVCEVLWQGSEELTMTTASIMKPKAPRKTWLHLRCGNAELVLEQANSTLVLGRDASCEVVVADRKASRQHARIERRQDKFFLIDQSTNGTFVVLPAEAEITLRHEELMLRGQGVIAFGRSVSESIEDTVSFAVKGGSAAA